MTEAVALPTYGFRTLSENRWARFTVRRTGRLLVSLWVLVTAAFLMIHVIPGDPVRAALGPTAPPELVAQWREDLGLNLPLWQQYLDYLQGLFTGDLGTSIVSRVPVIDIIAQRLPATASLALLAFIAAVIVAVPVGVGIAVATHRGRRRGLELGFASGSVFVSAIPDFLLGVALVYIFGVQLQLLPVAGRQGPESYILPVIALMVGPAAVLARIVRVEMLSVLDADYVRTARAKRLPRWRIYFNHALPNAVTATLTLAGLILSSLVIGTVFVESVFAWPGLGSTIVSAIQMKDYPVAQATVLVYGALVLIINTIIDWVLALLDPRTTLADS